MVRQVAFGPDLVRYRGTTRWHYPERFVPSGGARFAPGPATLPMPLDMYVTPDEAVVIAAAPGVDPRDLDISIQQNTLTISGTPQRQEPEQAHRMTWYLRELWPGRFQRTVMLPFDVDPGQAEALFEHGIVRITLPKAAWAKPQKIAVTAGASEQTALGAGSGSGTPQ